MNTNSCQLLGLSDLSSIVVRRKDQEEITIFMISVEGLAAETCYTKIHKPELNIQPQRNNIVNAHKHANIQDSNIIMIQVINEDAYIRTKSWMSYLPHY